MRICDEPHTRIHRDVLGCYRNSEIQAEANKEIIEHVF